MLKHLLLTAVLTLGTAALVQAETPGRVNGQISEIDTTTNVVRVTTDDGAVRRYQYQPGVIDQANLSTGDTVLVNPDHLTTGTVVGRFKNYLLVRPLGVEDGSRDVVVFVPAKHNDFVVGDRVVVWSTYHVTRLADGMDGYLASGDIVQYRRLEVAQLPQRRQVRLEERQTSVQQRQPQPVSAPEPIQTAPVRALW